LPLTLTRADARARRRALPRPRDGWVYGRGIASALKNVGYSFGFDDHATARVTRTPAGVDVAIGVAEVGQGVLTVLAQIAAATLCLPVARVQMVCEDTAAVPEGGSSSASRQTFVAGNAVRRACLLLRARGARRAQATFHAPRTQPVGHPRPTRLAYAHTWSSCVADVGVDLATGVVRVLRVVNAVDAGRVINPTLFTGQVEGGVVMGQGYALQEVLPVADGMPLATGLDACRLPTSLDAVPTIETIAIESPEPAGPFGARGIGEITMIPVVPAITAAIHAATGVWIDSIPARPERILAALAARPARS
jgi:CO/xanthine dehydrogenase Mo-binding subunit